MNAVLCISCQTTKFSPFSLPTSYPKTLGRFNRYCNQILCFFFYIQLPEFPLSYRTRCWIAHPCTPGHVADGAIHLTSDREGHLPIETLSLLYLTPQSWLHCHTERGKESQAGSSPWSMSPSLCSSLDKEWSKSKTQHYPTLLLS